MLGTNIWLESFKQKTQAEVYSKVCTQDLFESDLVRYTNMEMTVRNEEIYTYRSPEMGFPCGSAGKESACNAGDPGSIPGFRTSSGEGKGYPLQYSDLENSTDCIVHGVAKSQTWLRDLPFHLQCSAQGMSSLTLSATLFLLDRESGEKKSSRIPHMGKNPGQPGGKWGDGSMAQSRNFTGIFKGRNGWGTGSRFKFMIIFSG